MTMQDDEDLNPDQEIAALFLSEGNTDAVAGAAVGRSAKWVQRVRKDNPAFSVRVRELKEQRAERATAALGVLLEAAVDAVRRSLTCGRTADELRAAAMVFDRYRSFRDDTDTAQRLQELETDIDRLQAEVDSTEATDANGGL